MSIASLTFVFLGIYYVLEYNSPTYSKFSAASSLDCLLSHMKQKQQKLHPWTPVSQPPPPPPVPDGSHHGIRHRRPHTNPFKFEAPTPTWPRHPPLPRLTAPPLSCVSAPTPATNACLTWPHQLLIGKSEWGFRAMRLKFTCFFVWVEVLVGWGMGV